MEIEVELLKSPKFVMYFNKFYINLFLVDIDLLYIMKATPTNIFIFFQIAMEVILKPIFNILTIPDLKIKKPSWVTTPSPWTIFTFILLSYFLVTGTITNDQYIK